jgi:hypothetical protein
MTKAVTIVTLWWATKEFGCRVEMTPECNMVADAAVSNLGISEVENYGCMFFGLLIVSRAG